MPPAGNGVSVRCVAAGCRMIPMDVQGIGPDTGTQRHSITLGQLLFFGLVFIGAALLAMVPASATPVALAAELIWFVLGLVVAAVMYRR